MCPGSSKIEVLAPSMEEKASPPPLGLALETLANVQQEPSDVEEDPALSSPRGCTGALVPGAFCPGEALCRAVLGDFRASLEGAALFSPLRKKPVPSGRAA